MGVLTQASQNKVVYREAYLNQSGDYERMSNLCEEGYKLQKVPHC